MTCAYKIWVDGEKITTSDIEQVLQAKGIKKIGRTAAQDRAARGRTDRPKVFSSADATLSTQAYVEKWLKDNHLAP